MENLESANEDITEAVPFDEAEASQAIEEVLGEKEPGGPRARHVRMTPERAGKIRRECNTNNRPFSLADAEKLKHAIIPVNYKQNGDSVKISKTNKLLDGQHRLWAIEHAGITVPLLLVTGLDDEVFNTLDQGRKRSGADALAIKGVKRASMVSGACSMLYRILKDGPIGKGYAIPAYDIQAIWERHPGIVDAVEACIPIYQQGEGDPVIGLSYLAAYRYLIDPLLAETEKAASLVEGLIIGANLDADDPRFRFRGRVADARKRSHSMTGGAKLALLSKVVGMHLAGERVGRSLPTPDGSEKFSDFIPQMAEALAALKPEERFADLDY